MWDKDKEGRCMASLRYKDNNLCEVEMYVGREYSLFKLFCNISQELGKGFYVDFTLGKRDIFIVKNNRAVVKASLSGGLIATIQFHKKLLNVVKNEIINQKGYERNFKNLILRDILNFNTDKIDRNLIPNGIDLLRILKSTFGGEIDVDIANGEVYVITNNRITALMKMSENSNDVYIFSDKSKAQKFVKNLKRIHCLAMGGFGFPFIYLFSFCI
jgi:hypothetical protein